MRLTDHDLKQLSQEYLASLSPEQLLHLSRKMLEDLRDARDRLNHPPTTALDHQEVMPLATKRLQRQREASRDTEEATEPEPKAQKEAASREQSDKRAASAKRSKRQAGKQAGSKGVVTSGIV
jgi:hypothetical protein